MTSAFWAEPPARLPAIICPTATAPSPSSTPTPTGSCGRCGARGSRAGDAVALHVANRAEFVGRCWPPSQRRGLRLTPINWHLTGDEAGYIVDDCEAKALVADAALGRRGRRGGRRGAPTSPVPLAVGGAIDGFERYDDALAREDGADIDDPMLGSADALHVGHDRPARRASHRPPPPAPPPPPASAIYGYTRPASDVHLCTGPLYHAAPLRLLAAAPLDAASASCSWTAGTPRRRCG